MNINPALIKSKIAIDESKEELQCSIISETDIKKLKS